MRYVQSKLVFRLLSSVPDSCINKLNEQFSDMMVPNGRMYLSDPLQEESDESEIAHLPRLVMDFNCKDFGRLRNLIDEINKC
jgi:hypothetical protein